MDHWEAPVDAWGFGESWCDHAVTCFYPMLRRLAFGFMAPLMSLLPLPLQAEVGSPSESKMIEFHQKWMNSLEQFSADPDLVEAIEITQIGLLANYGCKLIEEGVVKPDAVEDLLTRFYLEVYEAPNRDMAIRMQSWLLSDHILFPEEVVKLCDPKRILPRFQGLPISSPD